MSTHYSDIMRFIVRHNISIKNFTSLKSMIIKLTLKPHNRHRKLSQCPDLDLSENCINMVNPRKWPCWRHSKNTILQSRVQLEMKNKIKNREKKKEKLTPFSISGGA